MKKTPLRAKWKLFVLVWDKFISTDSGGFYQELII